MKGECVVRLLAEGGCFEVFGRKTADGQWALRSVSFTMGDDPDLWKAGGIPETGDLGAVIPDIWPRLTPRLVHPELRGWFADRFKPASVPERRRQEWLALFASHPPDRWSENE